MVSDVNVAATIHGHASRATELGAGSRPANAAEALRGAGKGRNSEGLGSGGRQVADDVNKQIKGYASSTSVNIGESIDLKVSVSPAQTFSAQFFRLGHYGGRGARLVLSVDNLAGIIEASGAIMVARGDLGSELGIEELPHVQKQIIRDCIALGKPVITATQMFESMVTSPAPTRAEVSDVAHAVFDGTSAVMLSAESAIGHDPVNTVATMARVADRADQEFDYDAWARRIRLLRKVAVGDGNARITDAMTGATWRAATEMGVDAIICISESGFTVRSIARFRPQMPIIAFSPVDRTVRQLTLSWGATPLLAPHRVDSLAMMDDLVRIARDAGHVRAGDVVAVLAGAGGGHELHATDVLRVMRVK